MYEVFLLVAGGLIGFGILLAIGLKYLAEERDYYDAIIQDKNDAIKAMRPRVKGQMVKGKAGWYARLVGKNHETTMHSETFEGKDGARHNLKLLGDGLEIEEVDESK